SPATEEAATAIISRPPPAVVAPTAITQARQPLPYAPPPAYYDYDEPRRRAFWPWLLALLFVAAAGVGGYFLYNEIQNQISGAKLKWKITQVNSDRDAGTVIDQTPAAGASVDQGTVVKLKVSKGPQPVAVPNVIGSTFATASSQLQGLGFAVARKDVDSNQPK